jgi:flagellin-like protein
LKSKSNHFRINSRAVSPVIAVLLMIVIAVAASLFAYAWVMGYLDFLGGKVNQGIQIQAINYDNVDTLTAYAQNVGPANATIANFYLNDVLVAYSIDTNPLGPGETATIIVTPYGGASPVTMKVVTADGNIFQLTKSLTGASGGGTPTPTPIILLDEDFNRADSNTVGNGWNEIDSDPSAEARILDNRLDFNTQDDANQPLVYITFDQQTTGKIRWSFTFNFERTGSEGTYEVFMQLGQGLTSAPTGDTIGVAVNLKWGGTNNGFSTHEGFGYYDGATVTQVATVSGSGGDATIEVIADLDAKTFDLTISGAGFISGTASTTGIPFDNIVNIDTLMIYLDNVNESNFGDLETDNISIQQVTP